MDVVRRNIQDMGGHVQLSCEPGKGTTHALPLTLATFILPLNHVTESLQPTNDQIYSVAGNERVMQVRGESAAGRDAGVLRGRRADRSHPHRGHHAPRIAVSRCWWIT